MQHFQTPVWSKKPYAQLDFWGRNSFSRGIWDKELGFKAGGEKPPQSWRCSPVVQGTRCPRGPGRAPRKPREENAESCPLLAGFSALPCPLSPLLLSEPRNLRPLPQISLHERRRRSASCCSARFPCLCCLIAAPEADAEPANVCSRNTWLLQSRLLVGRASCAP